MKTTVLFCFICVLPLSVCVEQESRSYSCCRDPEFDVDARCEQTWTIANKPVASFKDVPDGCEAPCEDVSSGRISLDSCLNVTVAVICPNGNKDTMVQERRFSFHAEACTENVTTKPPAQYKALNPNQRYGLIAVACLLPVVAVIYGVVHCNNQQRKKSFTNKTQLLV